VLPVRSGDQIYSIDPSQNLLVGRDGGAADCSDEYENSWGTPVNGVYYPSNETRVPCETDTDQLCYCPCCTFQILDYILYSSVFQSPSIPPTYEIIPLQIEAFKVVWTKRGLDVSKYLDLVDLSDHYPVLAKFYFTFIEPPQSWEDKSCVYNDTNLSVGLLWLFLILGISFALFFGICMISYKFCNCCKALRKRAKKALMSDKKAIDLTIYDADNDEDDTQQNLLNPDDVDDMLEEDYY